MAKEGISLKFDDDGEASILESEKGELCSGIIICENCSANGFCSVTGGHWALIDHCPLKKWNTFRLDFSTAPPPNSSAEGSCFVCGGNDFWRLIGGPDVCNVCHPCPYPEKSVERFNITKKKKENAKRITPKEPKRSVSVRPQKKKQAKIFS